jgi:hypothetical protein
MPGRWDVVNVRAVLDSIVVEGDLVDEDLTAVYKALLGGEKSRSFCDCFFERINCVVPTCVDGHPALAGTEDRHGDPGRLVEHPPACQP